MDKVGKEADKTMGSISSTLEKGMNLANSKLSAKTSAMQAIWEGNNTFLKKSSMPNQLKASIPLLLSQRLLHQKRANSLQEMQPF